MQIHSVVRKTKLKKHKIVGRGGRRGKTSGRGTKGQNARAGRKKRPEIRTIIKKLPKKRGYRFKSIQLKPVSLTFTQIEKYFNQGETVSPVTLAEKGFSVKQGTTLSKIKVLGTGTLTKKLTFSKCLVSAGAKAAIEALGGTIQ